VAQGHTRHIHETSPTELTHVWKGNSTPSCGLSHQASLHHVVERKLQDIHVVREFQDVFPDEM
jgi:hypothetical protein